MAKYTLEMRDDQCGETEEFDAATLADAKQEAEERVTDWVNGGDWGDNGAVVDVRWTLSVDGEEVWSDSTAVGVEPDHDALVEAAGGDTSCQHDWTSEGEGGLDENPGVWSTGGTSMSFASHCRKCGLHRNEHHTGSQRNPGEHDTVHYEQPETWCAECQRVECNCTVDAE